ncbi:MAG: adenylate/guanylate cyclase domain-containing protein [Phycisphaerae bacterium]|nr:adenylate/guanylate cyclase domain-containing protein [Phycisphaerae bacterium]
MSETDNQQDSGSRRTLAAIVFTDVAGFSALMEKDEDRTLRLVARDLDLIRNTCEQLGGKALKSTGDGLLMSFDSAVQAAACALQTQQELAEQARNLPPEDVLMHRIGIHLGDVFITENDVMGDGVNVAARIQTEAPPGGICISQTVYDVVKNRLGVKATYLGPRELKNIKEAVPVYRIILDAHAAAEAARIGRSAVLRRWITWLAAGAGVAAVAIIALLWIKPWGKEEPPAGVRRPGGQAAVTPGSGASQPTRPAGPKVPKALLDAARHEAVTTRNFPKMLQWLEEKGLKDTPLYARYSGMKILGVWVTGLLRNISHDKPLVLHTPGRQSPPRQILRIWTSDGQGDLVFEGPGGRREQDVKDIEPPLMARIALALMKDQPVVNPRIRIAVRAYIEECKDLGLIPQVFP